MRILMDTGLGRGVSEYRNVGDVCMLQVAVTRLQGLFPGASFEVLTDSAEDLARFCPAARPLENLGRRLWFANGVLLGKYSRCAPSWLVDLLVKFKRAVRSRCPGLFRVMLIWRFKFRNRSGEAGALRAFTRALHDADLLLICGAGGFYDGCREWNLEVLDLAEAFIERGLPVVMLGQGFGPVSDGLVLPRAAKILPRVDYITLRGNRGACDLLRTLGVAESRMQITGDEALEMAYESRSDQRGQALGINLRFAGSAGADGDDIENIRAVLQDFVQRHGNSFVPLPIAMHPHSRDDLAIKQLLRGLDEQSDGGGALDSPLKVIRQTALCRIVVTGAYHAAVFALAQGIPVVGIAKSAYYSSKFFGLEDLFGEGCQTILLNGPGWPQRLQSAIEKAWKNADKLRRPLQAAALAQIESSKRSYERVRDIVASRNANACRADVSKTPLIQRLENGSKPPGILLKDKSQFVSAKKL